VPTVRPGISTTRLATGAGNDPRLRFVTDTGTERGAVRVRHRSVVGRGGPVPKKNTERTVVYRAAPTICNACPVKSACTPSTNGRTMHRSFDIEYVERVQGYHETEEYKKAMRKRKVWIEPLFGEAKQWHGLRQFRLQGLQKVNMEGLMIAAGQNLKRLLSAKGWGRRPWPDGAAGFAAIGLQICITLV
jgi:hypothetical protein